jgi:hypothetical protein
VSVAIIWPLRVDAIKWKLDVFAINERNVLIAYLILDLKVANARLRDAWNWTDFIALYAILTTISLMELVQWQTALPGKMDSVRYVNQDTTTSKENAFKVHQFKLNDISQSWHKE